MELENQILDVLEEKNIYSKSELTRILRDEYDVDYEQNTIYRFLDVMEGEGKIKLREAGRNIAIEEVKDDGA